MSRPAKPKDLEAVLDVAACAYDFIAEQESPAADAVMRRATRERLSASVRLLLVEDRVFLARRAGR